MAAATTTLPPAVSLALGALSVWLVLTLLPRCAAGARSVQRPLAASARRAVVSARAAAATDTQVMRVAADGDLSTVSIESIVRPLIAEALREAKEDATRKADAAHTNARNYTNDVKNGLTGSLQSKSAMAPYLKTGDQLYMEWKGGDADSHLKHASRTWVGLKNGNDNPLELQEQRHRHYFRVHQK
jgi:hypothetical protein